MGYNVANLYKQAFLEAGMNAVATSLEAGITPDYLFIDPSFFPGNRPTEFCGLKLWETKLPEGKKIIAVRVHSSDTKAKKDSYESVRELFEDNYHEDPTYETSVSDGTEVEK